MYHPKGVPRPHREERKYVTLIAFILTCVTVIALILTYVTVIAFILTYEIILFFGAYNHPIIIVYSVVLML